MKANSILKIAIVAMAAFGAYAFSGNTNTNQFKPYSVRDGKTCVNILAKCSENLNGSICTIEMNGSSKQVLGLTCTYEVYHDNSQNVDWEPIP